MAECPTLVRLEGLLSVSLSTSQKRGFLAAGVSLGLPALRFLFPVVRDERVPGCTFQRDKGFLANFFHKMAVRTNHESTWKCSNHKNQMPMVEDLLARRISRLHRLASSPPRWSPVQKERERHGKNKSFGHLKKRMKVRVWT